MRRRYKVMGPYGKQTSQNRWAIVDTDNNKAVGYERTRAKAKETMDRLNEEHDGQTEKGIRLHPLGMHSEEDLPSSTGPEEA